jgi:hypothetical protein
MSKYHIDRQVLCHEVCRVSLARYFGQWHYLSGTLLLQPQTVYVYMTHFGNSLSIENALRSSCIKFQSDADIGGHVHAEGLDTQAFAGSSHYTVQLGFG